MPSPQKRRTWITIVHQDDAPGSYGAWMYVDDGASSSVLVAPTEPGRYEVRLHSDYPMREYHLRQAEPLDVLPAAVSAPAARLFSVTSHDVAAGGKLDVRFPARLHSPSGERYWITVVARGEPDTTWGQWKFVAEGAREETLAAPASAGDYEVRLHANYPRLATNVVERQVIRVK
jgi:hypothetical protein